MRAGGQSSPSPSHLPTDCGMGHRLSRNLEPNLCPGRDLNPGSLDWHSSMLTTRPPCIPFFLQQKIYPINICYQFNILELLFTATRSRTFPPRFSKKNVA